MVIKLIAITLKKASGPGFLHWAKQVDENRFEIYFMRKNNIYFFQSEVLYL
jgi:hypothetical protein